MYKHITLTFVCFILFAKICLAQQNNFYGLDKLSSSLITRISQDSSGFIWIATENGLNKFDGWNFTHYFRNDKDSTSLLGNFVESFLTDRDGLLWIASTRGIQYYCPYKDAFYSVKFPNNIHPSVKDIVQLHSGEIWIVTAGYGAFSINKHTLQATSIEKINKLLGNDYANCIIQDRANQIWVALSGNQIACISSNKETAKIYDLSIDSRYKIYDIAEDNMGRIFIAASSNIFLWDNIRQQFIRIDDSESATHIRGMTITKDGIIYIITAGKGLKYIDVNSMKLNNSATLPAGYNNLIKERVTALFEDSKGNFWFGCYKKGLLKELNEPMQFEFWDLTDTGEVGSITSIYRDRENQLWVGSGNGKLLKLNEKGAILSSFNVQKDIACMYEDADGTFWLGSHQGGLFAFNKQTGKCTSYPKLEGKSVIAITGDKKNDVYISLLGEGFVRYNIKTKEWVKISDTTPLKNSKSLFNNWISHILCDSEGLIWFAHSTGVDCYDPERNVFLDFTDSSVLQTVIATTLLDDKRKNIWIGTNNGLYRYNKEDKTLKHYGMDEGLPNNIICGLGADVYGNIWGSTLNGLFQLNYKDERIACYYPGNGLIDREYSKNSSFQDKDGYIYFGGLSGVTKFMPDSVKTERMDYHPILTHLYLNNVSVSSTKIINGKPISNTNFNITSEINLSSNEKSFSLEFSTMNFHNPENIIFEYRLLEMSDEWHSTFPGENRITYNFLSPGDYKLEVRAFENNTYSSIKSFNIHIAPPWYSTSWAIFLYVFAFIGLLAGISYTWYKRHRRKQEEQRNEEKLKFFFNIAHEIRSPITLIISPLSELLKREYDENTSKLLKTMQLNANRIMNLINQLLDIRKIDKGQMNIICEETNLVEYSRALLHMFDYEVSKRNIYFSFESDADHIPVWIDRNNFDKILINLLVNAFKYTQDGGEIIVSLTFPKARASSGLSKYVEMRIIDSGLGLNEKKIERIFERFYQTSSHSPLGFGIGLNLTKMLVELHHGTIYASNRTDSQGSCFTVCLPLGKEHLKDEEIYGHHQARRIALDTPLYWEEMDNSVATTINRKRQRVLVVDDDAGMREYLQRELCQMYRVITAESGSEALQILFSQRIELVISDIKMPDIDGFTLLKKIKSNDNISHIPVVLLTSQVEFHNRMKGWNVGADGFMDKPFQIEELCLLCDNLISNRSMLKGKFAGIKELENKVNQLDIKSNDELFVDRLMNLINKNLDNSKFSVEILAKEVGISRTQLHRKLKDIAGITTSDFIRNVRLKQAAKLLVEKKVNISQVAYATGFSSPAIFAVAFKKFYGCTPTEYADKDVEENPT